MTTNTDTAILRTRRWLETLAISLSGPAAGMIFHPADPFWLHARLPWLLLLPLLCGAQYGLSHAAVSSGLLALLAYGHTLGHAPGDSALVSGWSLGGLILGAVSGQFRDMREEQKRRLTEQAGQLTEQLERTERAARVLKLSHARLSERLMASRWSLVGSVEEAQRRMQLLSSRRELGEVLLEVLASQAMVQSASLYWSGAGLLLPIAVASLGSAPGGSALHPLVMRAYKTQRLAAVGDPSAAISSENGAVLAAVPVITSSGQLVGVVAVHQLPFMALQLDQLRQLFTIVGQLGDQMHDRLRALALETAGSPRAAAVAPLLAPPPLGRAEAGLAAQHAATPSAAARKALVARVFDSPN
jgi:hypothetical protein